jgi:TfoX/Sxy family transcriptional regulator of competence genes
MATKLEIAEYIADQMQSEGNISYKKMFGEYAIYQEDKVIAFVCDNQLFIKPTKAGREFLVEVEEADPYPGSKPWFLITEDKWDDADWLAELVLVTAPEVLPVKKKAPKKK